MRKTVEMLILLFLIGILMISCVATRKAVIIPKINKKYEKPDIPIPPKIKWVIINEKTAKKYNIKKPGWVYYGVDDSNYIKLTSHILKTNEYIEKQNNLILMYEKDNTIPNGEAKEHDESSS